jgi:hypothetical protein
LLNTHQNTLRCLVVTNTQALDEVVSDISARLFSMAMRYGPTIKSVMAGESTASAIEQVEARIEP